MIGSLQTRIRNSIPDFARKSLTPKQKRLASTSRGYSNLTFSEGVPPRLCNTLEQQNCSGKIQTPPPESRIQFRAWGIHVAVYNIWRIDFTFGDTPSRSPPSSPFQIHGQLRPI